MIQRIQTVYLLLAAILLGLIFLIPIAEINGDAVVYELNETGFVSNSTNSDSNIVLKDIQPIFPISIWIGITLVFILLTVALFKKRGLQIKLNYLNTLLTLGLIVFLFYTADTFSAGLGQDTQTTYKVGLYLAVAALPFLILANRSIKKDENLIKSLDRIR